MKYLWFTKFFLENIYCILIKKFKNQKTDTNDFGPYYTYSLNGTRNCNRSIFNKGNSNFSASLDYRRRHLT